MLLRCHREDVRSGALKYHSSLVQIIPCWIHTNKAALTIKLALKPPQLDPLPNVIEHFVISLCIVSNTNHFPFESQNHLKHNEIVKCYTVSINRIFLPTLTIYQKYKETCSFGNVLVKSLIAK